MTSLTRQVYWYNIDTNTMEVAKYFLIVLKAQLSKMKPILGPIIKSRTYG